MNLRLCDEPIQTNVVCKSVLNTFKVPSGLLFPAVSTVTTACMLFRW